ncbi:hypothetical protein Tsubulata_015587, partial [Turnera subulata]
MVRGAQILLLCSAVLTLATCTLAGIPKARTREVYGNGRIFDITHEVNPNMPAFESKDGVGQFMRLVNSIKNGSRWNDGVLTLSTHTGTHTDSPGHFYEEYYEAGYNVDTLDLDVLN